MKKKLFLLLATTTSLGASAQTMLNLSGSSYYQSFDKIGSGLLKGWEVDSLASSTSKGFAMNFDTNPNAWSNATGKSKNVAAKDTLSSTASTTLQNAARNRALGVRQTTPIDIGVAFTLTISQTQSLSNLNIAFNLQSLDANSKRTTIWQVQYGIGATPSTFTTVSASSTNGLTTGNSTFSNSVVTASFGSALDSQLGPVVIRVVTLNGTVGTNSRATSAIDSFALSWTGTPVVYEPQLISFTPTNNATGVPTATNLVLTFDKNITAGTGKVYLRNMTDKTSISKLTTSSDVIISGKVATVSSLGLALGKAYSVTFDTNAFMSGAFASFGIMDSTAWVFSTINPTI
ncbi:MAG: Ig-like domain-containing protein, partial [Chitinophagaceae bacterium]